MSNKKSIYLVTGAAGFIGSNLVEHLLNLGEIVIGLDNFSGGDRHNLTFVETHENRSNFRLIEGDIRDLETCRTACRDVDFVLHQAALGSVPRSIEEPLLYNENNITGTLNMLIASRDAKVKRFVFASSSSVYGDTPALPKVETMTPSPKSPYAIGKLVGEYYASIFYREYGMPTVSLRYFNIFGPRQNPQSQYAAVIPKFVTRYLKNESPVIFGDGTQTRDFTYIQNVVKANLNACEAKSIAFGHVFNIGCGTNFSLLSLYKKIKELTKGTAEPRFEPLRSGDVRDSLADIQRAEQDLNYKDLVFFDEGLENTVRWLTEKSPIIHQ